MTEFRLPDMLISMNQTTERPTPNPRPWWVRSARPTLLALVVTLTWVATNVAAETPVEPSALGSDRAERGKLVVFPEGEGMAGLLAYICVIKDDETIARVSTQFNEPIVFADLPPGSVKVVIIPAFGQKEYVRGQASVTIAAGQRSSVRLQCKVFPSRKLTIRVRGVDGEPAADIDVTLKDVTVDGVDLKRGVTTTSDGVVAFHVCAEHRYIATTSIVRGGPLTLSSEPIVMADED